MVTDDQLHKLIEVSQRWIAAQYSLLDNLYELGLLPPGYEAALRAQLDQMAAHLRGALPHR